MSGMRIASGGEKPCLGTELGGWRLAVGGEVERKYRIVGDRGPWQLIACSSYLSLYGAIASNREG